LNLKIEKIFDSDGKPVCYKNGEQFVSVWYRQHIIIRQCEESLAKMIVDSVNQHGILRKALLDIIDNDVGVNDDPYCVDRKCEQCIEMKTIAREAILGT
jgi:hypothetical protein